MLMKKIFTLCLGLVAALAVQAQSDFPLQFADKDGNIISDGTTLNFTEFEGDPDFGDILMPTNLYVKNTSDAEVQGGGIYTIQSIGSGAFQTCFPENCVQERKAGTYQTEHGTFAADVLKDMKTEWLPIDEGSCVVTYQLVTFKLNAISKTWGIDKRGPTITLNFNYSTAAISKSKADGNVRQVEYISLTGRRVQVPAHGMFIVKTTYADGTTKSTKKLF